MAKSNEIKIISKNRRARHDYNIVETYEAGVVLTGTEVKSLRLGNTSLSESYITVMNGELFVIGGRPRKNKTRRGKSGPGFAETTEN